MNEQHAVKFAKLRAAYSGHAQCLRWTAGRFFLSTLRAGDEQLPNHFATIQPDGTVSRK